MTEEEEYVEAPEDGKPMVRGPCNSPEELKGFCRVSNQPKSPKVNTTS